MTEKQILLVKHSWSYLASQLEETAAVFSKKLMQVMPELKSLFKKTEAEAFHEVMITVNQLVYALPDVRKAEEEILRLIEKFSRRGMSSTEYDGALIAFLLTLEKKLGKSWTQELRESWVFILASVRRHLSKQLQQRHQQQVLN